MRHNYLACKNKTNQVLFYGVHIANSRCGFKSINIIYPIWCSSHHLLFHFSFSFSVMSVLTSCCLASFGTEKRGKLCESSPASHSLSCIRLTLSLQVAPTGNMDDGSCDQRQSLCVAYSRVPGRLMGTPFAISWAAIWDYWFQLKTQPRHSQWWTHTSAQSILMLYHGARSTSLHLCLTTMGQSILEGHHSTKTVDGETNNHNWLRRLMIWRRRRQLFLFQLFHRV